MEVVLLKTKSLENKITTRSKSEIELEVSNGEEDEEIQSEEESQCNQKNFTSKIIPSNDNYSKLKNSC